MNPTQKNEVQDESDWSSESDGISSSDAERKCVLLTSFGFECPSHPDSHKARVIDVRHLQNPTKTMISKGMTGLDKKLRDDFFSNELAENFYHQSLALIRDAINDSDNKLEFSFGCHRGKHRSVSFVERMRIDLEKAGISVSVFHHGLKGPKLSKDYKKRALSKRSLNYDEE